LAELEVQKYLPSFPYWSEGVEYSVFLKLVIGMFSICLIVGVFFVRIL